MPQKYPARNGRNRFVTLRGATTARCLRCDELGYYPISGAASIEEQRTTLSTRPPGGSRQRSSGDTLKFTEYQ